jgi:hypothetical protein
MDRRHFIKIALGGTGAGLMCLGIPNGMPQEVVKGLEFELDEQTGLVICKNNTDIQQTVHATIYGSGNDYSHLYIVGSTGDRAQWSLNEDLSQKVIHGFFGKSDK